MEASGNRKCRVKHFTRSERHENQCLSMLGEWKTSSTDAKSIRIQRWTSGFDRIFKSIRMTLMTLPSRKTDFSRLPNPERAHY